MKYFIFPIPYDSVCRLEHDSGWAKFAYPETHPSGRPGKSFDIPEDTPNGWGARLTISAPDHYSLTLRGMLTKLDGSLWGLMVDDFSLDAFEKKYTEPVEPTPNPEPPEPELTQYPIDIIRDIQSRSNYNLASKEGCGQLTEEACTVLNEVQSPDWGHIRKSGAQNQFNGHAVDAIMLLVGYMLDDGEFIGAGVYDIILSSESPDATVQFIWKHGPQHELWYYPS